MAEYDPGADAVARYPEVIVRHRRLGGIPAVSDPQRGVILIDRDGCRAERRTWLAHEIAHLDLAHESCPTGVEECRREHRADRLAAARLITLDELADALRWALGPEEVAAELDVTPHMVKVRLRALTSEEKAYIEARIETHEGIA